MTLLVFGSVYTTEKVGDRVLPASVPAMVAPPTVKLKLPLAAPACVAVKTIWKVRLWLGFTVAGRAARDLT